MNSKEKIFSIVSAEELLNRLSLRETLQICTEVMTDDELSALFSDIDEKISIEVEIPETEKEEKVKETIKEETPKEVRKENLPDTKKKTEPAKRTRSRKGTYSHKRILELEDKILGLKGTFTIKMIQNGFINGETYGRSTVDNAIHSLKIKGLIDFKTIGSSERHYWVVKPETKKQEPPKEEPKPAKEEPKQEEPKKQENIQPVKKPEVVKIVKKPEVTCKDLYNTPNLIDCILKELFLRGKHVMEPMGQYDIKELLYKHFGEKLSEKFDLGVNNVNLMHAGHALLEYLSQHGEHVRKNINGTFSARANSMKQLAKAKGWN